MSDNAFFLFVILPVIAAVGVGVTLLLWWIMSMARKEERRRRKAQDALGRIADDLKRGP